jgi:hypothetical protein
LSPFVNDSAKWDTGRFSPVTLGLAACAVTDPPPFVETARNSHPFMKLEYAGGIPLTLAVCNCRASLHQVPPLTDTCQSLSASACRWQPR